MMKQKPEEEGFIDENARMHLTSIDRACTDDTERQSSP